MVKTLIYIISVILICSLVIIQQASAFEIYFNVKHENEKNIQICLKVKNKDLKCDRLNLNNKDNPYKTDAWVISSKDIKKGKKFDVCVINLKIKSEECYIGTNNIGKQDELLELNVPNEKNKENNEKKDKVKNTNSKKEKKTVPVYEDSKMLRINFDSITMNSDHDSNKGRGEIYLTTVINNKYVLNLLHNEKIYAGQSKSFEKLEKKLENKLENEVIVEVPIKEELKISIDGYEEDDFLVPPIPFPYGKLGELAGNIINFLDSDDNLGIVYEEYNIENNFGIGQHEITSKFDGENEDTKGDYLIRYTINEIPM